ncbi:sodium:calcium antiporter [Ornithinimicrobium sp. CNJ-824]|uniref:calcium/sodium antiporter n=1 Tax=Ornithinimicrobium sp. CNJ-824 TaxID=1904966 RepID=UPI000969D1E0|nr:calcium/sodium antiporter [Ornithinimicrobium sp. CNJ-824]OLT21528.1 sodium:calcium antiporter [Ornithinimicrobium sp. CNJ-824]
MDLLDVARIVLGLVLLVGGGELLVRGASALAVRSGLTPLVVGLTVVSVATSAPELAVTTGAALRGETELALGNVVGSNIANVLLILGVSALILPLTARRRIVRVDVPVMLALGVLALLLSLDGRIGVGDGVVLLTIFVAHLVASVWIARRDPGDGPAPAPGTEEGRGEDETAGPDDGVLPLWAAVLLVLGGVVLLVVGAGQLVSGATAVATALGVSGLVVGLTVVAVGTSLPELAASAVAALRGERDLALGNVVGSCIANLGLVLGLPALLARGLDVPAAVLALDLPVMLATSLVLLPVAFTGFVVARWEGGLFVALYGAYVGYVVLQATSHDALSGFTTVMTLFVLPFVVLAVATTAAYELGRISERRRRAAAGG